MENTYFVSAEVNLSIFKEKWTTFMWSINSFFQTKASPCVNLHYAVVRCILSFFEAGLSLLSSRESSINLSDNVNDRLCSARNTTTIASILATMSRMCTVGVVGTSGVLDGDVEASHYTGGAPCMTFASDILAPGVICCFPSRVLRSFRCFNRWRCCLMVPRPPSV